MNMHFPTSQFCLFSPFRGMGGLFLLLLVTSCSKDLGNYDYEPKSEITIDLPKSITVLSNAEYIDLKPVIKSKLEGVITADNENFTYSFRCQNSDGDWVELNETGGQNIYMLATLSIGKHVCWYAMTDKRTGIRTSAEVDVNVVVSTSEGWMVLCNSGDDEQVRLDMISNLSGERFMPVYDIDIYKEVAPFHHATSLGVFFNRRGTIKDKIVILSEEASYLLNNTYLTINGYAYDLKTSHFVSLPDDHIITFKTVPSSDYVVANAVLAVSSEGNAFVWNPWDTGGGAFEEAINTSSRAAAPEYHVAPFIGVSKARSTALASYGCALLYDTDNHRFVAWDGDRVAAMKQTLYPLKDPSSKLFSFQTGSMEVLDMVGTAFSGGAVYCFMQDGTKRHIYSINVADKNFKQEGCWANVTTPDFDKATHFAAHSQYQTIYYAYNNKVYAYNPASGTCREAITLAPNEEVTDLTFCMYDEPAGAAFLTTKMSDEEAARFIARQYNLIVASYDKNSTDGNGGIVRFYETESPGTTLTMAEGCEFKGFGRVKDIVYKEQRP